jgi:hypothetical protein
MENFLRTIVLTVSRPNRIEGGGARQTAERRIESLFDSRRRRRERLKEGLETPRYVDARRSTDQAPRAYAKPGLSACVAGLGRLDAAAESEALNDRERLLMQQGLQAQRHDQYVYRIAPFDPPWSAFPRARLDAPNADEDGPDSSPDCDGWDPRPHRDPTERVGVTSPIRAEVVH